MWCIECLDAPIPRCWDTRLQECLGYRGAVIDRYGDAGFTAARLSGYVGAGDDGRSWGPADCNGVRLAEPSPGWNILWDSRLPRQCPWLLPCMVINGWYPGVKTVLVVAVLSWTVFHIL